jgi:hypothetical protein
MLSKYWWDAYLWNIDGITVWPVWFLLLSIALVLLIQMALKPTKRKIKSLALVICIVVSLYMPFTGHFDDELAFRQACAENAGLTIHKSVEMPPSMILPIDPEIGPKGKNNLLIFRNQGYEIDESWFSSNFLFTLKNGKDDIKFSFGEIRNKQNGKLISIFKTYYGYSGFLSGGIRMCEDVFPNLKEELNKNDIYQLQYTFGIEIKNS